MAEKEKAIELANRMHLFSSGDSGKDDLEKANAKQCALICNQEKIQLIVDLEYEYGFDLSKETKKLQEEKQEINNL